MTSTASSWAPTHLGAEEHFFVATPEGKGTFACQLVLAFEHYEAALASAGLDLASGITVTIFLSDSANQEDVVRQHPGFLRLVDAGVPVTIIQQPPIGAKIALLAYHIQPHRHQDRTLLCISGCKSKAMGISVKRGPYQFYYLRNLLSPHQGTAGNQTEALLGIAGNGAQSEGIVLSEVIRTWIYISFIDANYTAVSRTRNGVFDRNGITRDHGFPASTGIEGRSSDGGDLVQLDVLAIKGLHPDQSRPMEALTHMNATVDYGVTFERGREVVFGDRRHLYVSGTASISNKGVVLHPGEISAQARRAIENISVLLGNSGASLTDLRYVIVYLRDAVDAAAVEAVISEGPLQDVPRILVHAAVCRPGWLVELEGVAIDGKGEARFAAF